MLSQLQILSFGGNNFNGEVPASFGNLSSLEILDLGRDRLHGVIPSSFGQLKALTHIEFGVNYFTGTIPLSLYNLSFKYFSVLQNQLEVTLPPDLGHTLPNLEILFFYTNNLGSDYSRFNL